MRPRAEVPLPTDGGAAGLLRWPLPPLLLLAGASLLTALVIGPDGVDPDPLWRGISGRADAVDALILTEIRLPRALAAFAVGAMLGLSGAALQGLLRNPLAEPGVLGVSATAVLFATTTIYLGVSAAFSAALPLAAITGALVATLLLSWLAIRLRSVVTLILVGVGLSSFAAALLALLLNFAPTPFSLSEMLNWSLGSVANRSLADLSLVLPFMLVGTGLLLASGDGLTVLTLGESVAASLGARLTRTRLLVVTGTGLCTGAAVALAGAVGFVGIIAPHLVRRHVDHLPGRTLLPAALLAGALLVLADTLIRLLPARGELRLGVVAALFGAPLFVLIAAGWQRERRDD